MQLLGYKDWGKRILPIKFTKEREEKEKRALEVVLQAWDGVEQHLMSWKIGFLHRSIKKTMLICAMTWHKPGHNSSLCLSIYSSSRLYCQMNFIHLHFSHSRTTFQNVLNRLHKTVFNCEAVTQLYKSSGYNTKPKYR